MERSHVPSGLVAVSLALLLAASAALAGCKNAAPASTSSTPTSTAASTSATNTGLPSLQELSKGNLAVMKESLLFSYVQVGGIPALESRFGKPSVTYQTYAKDPSGGSYELPDGRAYRFEWGFDSSGQAVVISHTVEASSAKQKPTAGDKAFVSALVDGKTTIDEANAYLKRVGGKKARLAEIDPTAVKVPALTWNQSDGSGFIVIDLTSLTPAQMSAIGMEDSGPYQGLYWDATHWRAFEG